MSPLPETRAVCSDQPCKHGKYQPFHQADALPLRCRFHKPSYRQLRRHSHHLVIRLGWESRTHNFSGLTHYIRTPMASLFLHFHVPFQSADALSSPVSTNLRPIELAPGIALVRWCYKSCNEVNPPYLQEPLQLISSQMSCILHCAEDKVFCQVCLRLDAQRIVRTNGKSGGGEGRTARGGGSNAALAATLNPKLRTWRRLEYRIFSAQVIVQNSGDLQLQYL
jgi:hypothetical protein